ncbi:hypothetical protein BLNAU_14209 [Blattamonas nauphoetae]|uniref:Uncharacterized protein n=1 Tax=Blattamonas nauphoetae TaxID=2049346 RepID=A0ABQ9XJX3_9EUKA|nr:hypothetical protein BLNAU_14209 [Blattamonas nauphoetae]
MSFVRNNTPPSQLDGQQGQPPNNANRHIVDPLDFTLTGAVNVDDDATLSPSPFVSTGNRLYVGDLNPNTNPQLPRTQPLTSPLSPPNELASSRIITNPHGSSSSTTLSSLYQDGSIRQQTAHSPSSIMSVPVFVSPPGLGRSESSSPMGTFASNRPADHTLLQPLASQSHDTTERPEIQNSSESSSVRAEFGVHSSLSTVHNTQTTIDSTSPLAQTQTPQPVQPTDLSPKINSQSITPPSTLLNASGQRDSPVSAVFFQISNAEDTDSTQTSTSSISNPISSSSASQQPSQSSQRSPQVPSFDTSTPSPPSFSTSTQPPHISSEVTFRSPSSVSPITPVHFMRMSVDSVQTGRTSTQTLYEADFALYTDQNQLQAQQTDDEAKKTSQDVENQQKTQPQPTRLDANSLVNKSAPAPPTISLNNRDGVCVVPSSSSERVKETSTDQVPLPSFAAAGIGTSDLLASPTQPPTLPTLPSAAPTIPSSISVDRPFMDFTQSAPDACFALQSFPHDSLANLSMAQTWTQSPFDPGSPFFFNTIRSSGSSKRSWQMLSSEWGAKEVDGMGGKRGFEESGSFVYRPLTPSLFFPPTGVPFPPFPYPAVSSTQPDPLTASQTLSSFLVPPATIKPVHLSTSFTLPSPLTAVAFQPSLIRSLLFLRGTFRNLFKAPNHLRKVGVSVVVGADKQSQTNVLFVSKSEKMKAGLDNMSHSEASRRTGAVFEIEDDEKGVKLIPRPSPSTPLSTNPLSSSLLSPRTQRSSLSSSSSSTSSKLSQRPPRPTSAKGTPKAVNRTSSLSFQSPRTSSLFSSKSTSSSLSDSSASSKSQPAIGGITPCHTPVPDSPPTISIKVDSAIRNQHSSLTVSRLYNDRVLPLISSLWNQNRDEMLTVFSTFTQPDIQSPPMKDRFRIENSEMMSIIFGTSGYFGLLEKILLNAFDTIRDDQFALNPSLSAHSTTPSPPPMPRAPDSFLVSTTPLPNSKQNRDWIVRLSCYSVTDENRVKPLHLLTARNSTKKPFLSEEIETLIQTEQTKILDKLNTTLDVFGECVRNENEVKQAVQECQRNVAATIRLHSSQRVAQPAFMFSIAVESVSERPCDTLDRLSDVPPVVSCAQFFIACLPMDVKPQSTTRSSSVVFDDKTKPTPKSKRCPTPKMRERSLTPRTASRTTGSRSANFPSKSPIDVTPHAVAESPSLVFRKGADEASKRDGVKPTQTEGSLDTLISAVHSNATQETLRALIEISERQTNTPLISEKLLIEASRERFDEAEEQTLVGSIIPRMMMETSPMGVECVVLVKEGGNEKESELLLRTAGWVSGLKTGQRRRGELVNDMSSFISSKFQPSPQSRPSTVDSLHSFRPVVTSLDLSSLGAQPPHPQIQSQQQNTTTTMPIPSPLTGSMNSTWASRDGEDKTHTVPVGQSEHQPTEDSHVNATPGLSRTAQRPSTSSLSSDALPPSLNSTARTDSFEHYSVPPLTKQNTNSSIQTYMTSTQFGLSTRQSQLESTHDLNELNDGKEITPQESPQTHLHRSPAPRQPSAVFPEATSGFAGRDNPYSRLCLEPIHDEEHNEPGPQQQDVSLSSFLPPSNYPVSSPMNSSPTTFYPASACCSTSQFPAATSTSSDSPFENSQLLNQTLSSPLLAECCYPTLFHARHSLISSLREKKEELKMLICMLETALGHRNSDDRSQDADKSQNKIRLPQNALPHDSNPSVSHQSQQTFHPPRSSSLVSSWAFDSVPDEKTVSKLRMAIGAKEKEVLDVCISVEVMNGRCVSEEPSVTGRGRESIGLTLIAEWMRGEWQKLDKQRNAVVLQLRKDVDQMKQHIALLSRTLSSVMSSLSTNNHHQQPLTGRMDFNNIPPQQQEISSQL